MIVRRSILPACLLLSTAGCSWVQPLLPKQSPSVVASLSTPASEKANAAASRKLEFAICFETAELARRRGMDEEAIGQYESARRADPGARGISHPLAVLYDRAGMTDAAEREYLAALAEKGEEPDLLCDYGYFLYSRGRLDEAETKLRAAVKKTPSHRQAKVNLAMVCAAQGDYPQAERLFSEAIGPAAALHNIGMLKLRAGQRDEALAALEAAARRDPSLGETQQVIAQLRSNRF